MTEIERIERIELINSKDDGDEFFEYCCCVKTVLNARECTCNYTCVATSLPLLFVFDMLVSIPQFVMNNIKLCLR